jgi:colicin import membrane protein
VNTSTRDPLRPRRPGGMGQGALFALLAHIGLLLALAFGVSWRSSEPAGVSAELWAAVPEQAAPAAVAPPPAPEPPRPQPKPEPVTPPKPDPREAEIAIEKAKVEKQRQREREEREEREQREKAEAAKKRQQQQEAEAKARAEKLEQAEAERVARQREENLKRILGQAGATGGPNATGSAQRDAGPSASYAGRIVARVKPNIVLTDSVPPTLRAEVEVRAAADGTIVGRRLVKSSGNSVWDDAVLRAIDRTETLPRDTDGRVPSPIVIEFRPF